MHILHTVLLTPYHKTFKSIKNKKRLFPILWKVLLFFDNLYIPSSCQCGETIAVHPKMFLNYCKDSKRDTNGVTEAAIRSFIRQQLIGCTSNCVWFHGSRVQVSAVHISRAWFQEDVLKKLNECEYKNLHA